MCRSAASLCPRCLVLTKMLGLCQFDSIIPCLTPQMHPLTALHLVPACAQDTSCVAGWPQLHDLLCHCVILSSSPVQPPMMGSCCWCSWEAYPELLRNWAALHTWAFPTRKHLQVARIFFKLCLPACSYWCASSANIQPCAAQGLNTLPPCLQLLVCELRQHPDLCRARPEHFPADAHLWIQHKAVPHTESAPSAAMLPTMPPGKSRQQ